MIRVLDELFMHKENPFGAFHDRRRTGLFKSSGRVQNLKAYLQLPCYTSLEKVIEKGSLTGGNMKRSS